jgi:hypothetical protein
LKKTIQVRIDEDGVRREVMGQILLVATKIRDERDLPFPRNSVAQSASLRKKRSQIKVLPGTPDCGCMYEERMEDHLEGFSGSGSYSSL